MARRWLARMLTSPSQVYSLAEALNWLNRWLMSALVSRAFWISAKSWVELVVAEVAVDASAEFGWVFAALSNVSSF